MTQRADTPNVVTRGFTSIQFVDQYGEQRTIHRNRGSGLRIKKREDSVSHVLNRAVGVLTGARIKAKRIERGLSLDDLLTKAGLAAGSGQGKQRMWEIENAGVGTTRNKQGVRFGTLYALAIALECEVADLLPSSAEVASAAGVALVVPNECRVVRAA